MVPKPANWFGVAQKVKKMGEKKKISPKPHRKKKGGKKNNELFWGDPFWDPPNLGVTTDAKKGGGRSLFHNPTRGSILGWTGKQENKGSNLEWGPRRSTT